MKWAHRGASCEARQLKHPNVVRLLSAYRDDSQRVSLDGLGPKREDFLTELWTSNGAKFFGERLS